MNYDLYWIWMSCGLGAGASCLDLVSYYEWNPQEIYGSSFNKIFSLDVLTKRQIEKLKGLEAHSTVILSRVDEQTFRKLGVNLTCEPKYQTKKLYHA